MKTTFTLVLCLGISYPAFAAEHRSSTVTRQFERLNPCPANGHKYGPCPGWIKDHIIPLCAGGADTVANLQWQTVADAKIKDRAERKECAARH